MFGFNDIPKFILAFFIIMPLISVLHEAGHVFFAWLMGGKNIKVTVGSGKILFRWGPLEVRKYYFWYGLCTFENIKRKEKFANILIFFGGSLFNLIATIAVMVLVNEGYLEAGLVTYQFTYFSLYYIFFALFPMPYPDGNYSDGKIILDLLRGKGEIIIARTYRIQWNKEGKEWHVLNHDNNLINSYENEQDAIEKAREIARNNRPSKIMNTKEGQEIEIHNYPRIPL